MDAVEAREVVVKHHRDLETVLLIVWRQLTLVSLVVKVLGHDMGLEIPVTPVILLVAVDELSHRQR
jgi:hypothetical protein